MTTYFSYGMFVWLMGTSQYASFRDWVRTFGSQVWSDILLTHLKGMDHPRAREVEKSIIQLLKVSLPSGRRKHIMIETSSFNDDYYNFKSAQKKKKQVQRKKKIPIRSWILEKDTDGMFIVFSNFRGRKRNSGEGSIIACGIPDHETAYSIANLPEKYAQLRKLRMLIRRMAEAEDKDLNQLVQEGLKIIKK